MDLMLPSEQEMVNRMVEAARLAEATGNSRTVKELLKWIGGRQTPEAILLHLTPEQTAWLLKTIRTTRIQNKGQSERLVQLTETIEDRSRNR